MIRESLYFN